jgi:protein ImuB
MVSVWLPLFPIERLKRERQAEPFPDEKPFALVGCEERGLTLTAVNLAAARKGLYTGLSLADARAIHPSLLSAPADPKKDAASLIALARWSRHFSPTLNTHGVDGLWLDVTGIPHLFGGEESLLEHLAIRLSRFGFSANLALAETLGGAHALARYGRATPIIVKRGKIADALAPLPVEGLRLAEETIRLLKRLGLKRIGQLYDLPRASLERRFHSRDAAEAVLLRLDQALGKREEPLTPLLPASEFAAKLPFPEPLITHDGIIASLERLADELAAQLGAARRGAKRLKLTLYRADGSSAVVQAGLSAPARKASHFMCLFEDRIGDIDAGFGIDLMVLAAPLTEPLPPAQASFAKSEGRSRQEPLIDRLASRLSEGAVRRLYPSESHMPERAQMALSAFAGSQSWSEAKGTKPPRPCLLLERPEPLSVLAAVPEGPPARFTWRRVTRPVVKAEGPERIAPEWWLQLRTPSPDKGEGGDGQRPSPGGGHTPALMGSDPHPGPPPYRGREPARTRDYYRIEDDEGHRYWVFREGLYQESGATPEWYLHGVFG